MKSNVFALEPIETFKTDLEIINFSLYVLTSTWASTYHIDEIVQYLFSTLHSTCICLSEQVHYELDPYELCTYLSYLT